MASRHRSRVTRPRPATKIWLGNDIALTNLITNTSTLIGSFNAAVLALRPFTILRTRITCNFRSDQSGGTEDITGAFGMIVVEEVAVAAGIASVPTPLSEVNADFFVYQGMTAPFTFVSGVGIIDPAGERYDIDSKAMRKVDISDDVAIVFEMRSVGGGEINIEGRMLIQLH